MSARLPLELLERLRGRAPRWFTTAQTHDDVHWRIADKALNLGALWLVLDAARLARDVLGDVLGWVRWIRYVLGFGLLLVVVVSPAGAADLQEAVCDQSFVILCENFEDRGLGTSDMGRAKFKNQGWGISQPANNGVVADGQHSDGTKSFRWDYVAGWNTGGSGFMDSNWPSTYQDLYFRAYVAWSSNFKQSPTSTKHFEGSGLFNLWANQEGTRDIRMSTANLGDLLPVDNWRQNVNLPAFNIPTDGSWHCLEARWRQNTDGQSDGIVQGWVDGVQKWNFSNLLIVPPGIDPNQPPGTTYYQRWGPQTGLLLAAYLNCGGTGATEADNTTCVSKIPGDDHPAQSRWIDNIVVGTQRIGCLGAGPFAPAPPTNLRFVSITGAILALSALLLGVSRMVRV